MLSRALCLVVAVSAPAFAEPRAFSAAEPLLLRRDGIHFRSDASTKKGRSEDAKIVERVLAVVDARPVLLSELRLARQVRAEEAGPALEALIDEHLMFAEALRLPQAALTDAEEAAALASLQAQMPGAAGDADALRRMARRQATILKYVDFRFRPQVRVAAADAEEKARLEAEELDARIEAWVKELRASAEVRYNVSRTVPASR
jgi:hypothetical protein